MSNPELIALAWNHLMLCREAVPSHFSNFYSRESDRKVNRGGSLKRRIVSNFCLRKILPFPWRRQDLCAVNRVSGQLPELPNLKSNSVYFLAFQRAVCNGDRLITRASPSTLRLCSLSSAFQSIKWLHQEMHTLPFWCHSSPRSDFYFEENLKIAKP